VEELQHLIGPSLSLAWEGRSPVLAGEARLTHLLHLCEKWHSLDEPVTPHLAQRNEVKMAKTSM
jgi:hypothetical protein